jgi:hypothetical protein
MYVSISPVFVFFLDGGLATISTIDSLFQSQFQTGSGQMAYSIKG